VWIGDLDPTVGREIQKVRPVLIVSPDSMNRNLSTVTVMPMTTGSRPAAFRVPARFRERDGLILADQLRTVDRSRLRHRLGVIEQATLLRALAVLRQMFEDEDDA
jgi:mRNA interferase MazF